MQISETWSVSAERIRTFFLTQSDVRQSMNESFFFGQCEIHVSSMPLRQMGRFRFSQTRVEFDGPEADTVEIHRRFVLQFISAGG